MNRWLETTARWGLVAGATLGLPLCAVSAATAQNSEPVVVVSADEALERYLETLDLRELLADHLLVRLGQVQGPERVQVADRLAKIYVRMLAETDDPQRARVWEERSRELLRAVPEVSSHELRINLARTIYIRAEEIAERARLRLATPEELAEAERMLRGIRPELGEVAGRVQGRVVQLERVEDSGRATENDVVELGEARRVRSLVHYYAGWTDYYLAELTRNDRLAMEAMKSFGWILNARGGSPATLENVSPGLLKFEHIARAAIGCALSASLRGNDVEAMRWLDAVDSAEGIAPEVRAQILPRKITILGKARRWADLERAVRLERRADRSGGGPDVRPLSVLAARLLAVQALEADRVVGPDVIEMLARIALGDLVARGETTQVLDIVRRYGTAPIGEHGFIVNFVRGMQAYERTREAHAQSGADTEEPATDADLIAAYREAAVLLEASLTQDDAATYAGERSRAALLVGFSLFYAGDLERAADRFMQAARDAGAEGQEALWLAVVSLDRAAKAGSGSAAQRRDEVATLFLQTYPGSPRAPQLLIGLSNTDLLDQEAALKILLGVPRSAAAYEGARRQAARILFSAYRNARGSDRDFAALRYLAVAEEVLGIERRLLAQPDRVAAREAADRAVIIVRQILDATLDVTTPDVQRAEAALGVLRNIVSAGGRDVSAFESELTYRRMQIALAEGDVTEAARLGDKLQNEGGPYADAADRHVYRRLVTAWVGTGDLSTAPDPGESVLRDVVRHGGRIIARTGSTPAALRDGATLSVHAVVAHAATRLWETTMDAQARDLALRLDRAILAVQPRAESSLRRVAVTAEGAGDTAGAAEAWSVLGAAARPGTDGWFESRANFIRLVAKIDAVRAREALRQYRAIYPDLGPEPWASMVRTAEAELPAASSVPAAAPPQPAAPAGGGS